MQALCQLSYSPGAGGIVSVGVRRAPAATTHSGSSPPGPMPTDMDPQTPAPKVTRTTLDAALAREWADLAERTGAAPFAHPGWLVPWAAATRTRLEPLTLRRGSHLAGILPLAWSRGAVRTPGDWHTPWFEAVAEDQAGLDALFEALAGTDRRRVTLDFVLEGGATAERGTTALAAAGYRLIPRTRLRSPYLLLEGTWEDYLASLSSHRRSELRRRARRLEAEGSLDLDVSPGGPDLGARLDEGLTLEAAGWKGRQGTAIAAHPGLAGFYRRMAAWAAEQGWLRLAFLRLDGRALAFDLALEAGGRHFLLKTGYDPKYAALAPGLLLRVRMLERAFALGLASYEFGGADEPWKLVWAPAVRPVLAVEGFAPGIAGAWARASARLNRLLTATSDRPRRRPPPG
jgi:CelD/BcsL family acetyltransferase involved in cellulose biosynthesis